MNSYKNTVDKLLYFVFCYLLHIYYLICEGHEEQTSLKHILDSDLNSIKTYTSNHYIPTFNLGKIILFHHM